jgi:hypothetical protein
LPSYALIHLVFHVSQLKSFHTLILHTYFFSELPVVPTLDKGEVILEGVLARQPVKKGRKVIPHAKIKWAHLPEEATTCEDWYVLLKRFVEFHVGGPT